jgi:hypothetical protein
LLFSLTAFALLVRSFWLFITLYAIDNIDFSFHSLMYGAEDPSIAGMVLDSPFSDLVDLMMELVDTYKIRLPKFTVSKFYLQKLLNTQILRQDCKTHIYLV